MAIMPYTTQQWTRFLECVGRSEMLREPWVQDPVQRSANVDALYQIIADAAPTRTNAEWLTVLRAADIPCGPVNGFEELFAEPHLTGVGLFRPVDHPTEGPLTAVRSPFRAVTEPRQADRPAPTIGESSKAILRELGYSGEEINQLFAQRIAACSHAAHSD
jgi:crotonobetainyl-CoA:carnitine CoA-transferase CaiB-like acyl-CoA transferase